MGLLLEDIDLLLFISAIAVTSIGFILYTWIVSPGFTQRVLHLEMGKPLQVYVQRYAGAFIFGVIPVLIILLSGAGSLEGFGLKVPHDATYLWTMALSILIIPLNFFNAPKPDNLKIYPQIREENWSVGLLIHSAISWIIYLLAYEFLFRGFLFFSSLSVLDLWPAIIVNTVIYALVHYPKGYKEMFGAIPLGVVLCYLTYLTGSIWIAVFTHIVLALSNEWFSLKAHPKMLFKKVRK